MFFVEECLRFILFWQFFKNSYDLLYVYVLLRGLGNQVNRVLFCIHRCKIWGFWNICLYSSYGIQFYISKIPMQCCLCFSFSADQISDRFRDCGYNPKVRDCSIIFFIFVERQLVGISHIQCSQCRQYLLFESCACYLLFFLH